MEAAYPPRAESSRNSIRQIATAWDGVALEVRREDPTMPYLLEDGFVVVYPQAGKTMAELRRIAWERARDRMRVDWGMPDVDLNPAITWTTYP
jgi:hypothetical protein